MGTFGESMVPLGAICHKAQTVIEQGFKLDFAKIFSL